MTAGANYIHGTDAAEQRRLALLNRISNDGFLEFLRVEEARTVLEVGSGIGILAAEATARCPDGFVCGVEISEEQIATARWRTRPGVRFVRGDAHALPFGRGSFDLVYCRYLLEHVSRPAQVVREMRRVLRSGGRALVQENNILVNVLYPECPRFDAVWRAFARLQSILGGDALIGRRLLELFRSAGFQEVALSIQPEIHWQSSPLFQPWIENLIGNVRSAAHTLEAHGLATAVEIESAIREARDFAVLPDATAIFYWNRAEGTA